MIRGIHQNLDPQQTPAFFARGPSPLARLTFFSALSLALMATDSRLQYLANIRENLMTLLHPLQVIANVPTELYQSADEYFSTHHHLLAENARLKQQALVQGVALQRLDLLELENTNLRSLLDAKQSLVETSTLAEVLHVGRDAFSKKIIVNRGTNHQVVTGAAAVDAKGVVGQVTRTYPSSSEITLITDKSLSIPVQIERNGLRAIAFGHGRNNTLDLPYLPANVDIKRGDKLVTSGIDGVYPAGLAVATVIEMTTTQDSPFAQIICAPTGGIENDRQLLIVSVPKTTEAPAAKTSVVDKAKPTAAMKPSPATAGAQRLPVTKPERTPSAEPAAKKPLANVESRPHASQ